ncbi:hypothetical protein Bca101_082659 [Brassica carinata]
MPREGRAPDGGFKGVAIYEAYLEAGVRSGVPSLVAEVLGELRGFHIGVHEVLYSYCFAPLAKKPGFYFLRARDGAPLVGEPSRGAGENYPFGDNWDNRYVFMRIQEPIRYPTFWRIVDVSRPMSFAGEAVAKLVMETHLQFQWESFLVSKEDLRHSRSVVGLPLSAVFQNYQGVKAKRRRSSFNLPPRLARAAASASGPSPLPSVDAMTGVDYSLSKDIHQTLLTEVFSLRGQVQDMMAHIDRLIQQVSVATRWELMKEWLEERTGCWNPGEEYQRYLSLFGRPSMEPGRPTSTGSWTLAELPF